jgi:hypothetical protein
MQGPCEINKIFKISLCMSAGPKRKANKATIQIVKQSQAKTGTSDTQENLTVNLTETTLKIKQNTVKYTKVENYYKNELENVTPYNNKDLQDLNEMGVLGFEPKTYALKVRCSTN